MKSTKRVHYDFYMAAEGDALAAWLNQNPRSQLARHVKYFLISRAVIPAAHDTSANDFLTRLQEAVKARMPARKVERKPPLFNPARSYHVGIHLDFQVRPDGSYTLRVLPVTSTDSAMLLVIQLASAHQVHRLRQCAWAKCSKWFFARKETQMACCADCRKRAHESKLPPEELKARRREAMRRYRERQREERKR